MQKPKKYPHLKSVGILTAVKQMLGYSKLNTSNYCPGKEVRNNGGKKLYPTGLFWEKS